MGKLSLFPKVKNLRLYSISLIQKKMFILSVIHITLEIALARCRSASFFNMLYLVYTTDSNTRVTQILDKRLKSLCSQRIELILSGCPIVNKTL